MRFPVKSSVSDPSLQTANFNSPISNSLDLLLESKDRAIVEIARVQQTQQEDEMEDDFTVDQREKMEAEAKQLADKRARESATESARQLAIEEARRWARAMSTPN